LQIAPSVGRALLVGAVMLSSAFAQAPLSFPEPSGLSIPFVPTPGIEGTSEIARALRARDWERAEVLLVRKIEASPKSPELLTLLGNVFLADRKPLNAAIAIKKAEALGPIDNATRYTLVLAYVAMKRGDWARPELERLVVADSTNVLYEYWLGRLDYDEGQYAAAARRFESVVTRDEKFMRAYDNLGLCYEALNQPDLAIAPYRQAIALNQASPTPSPWPLLNLGTLLRQRGELGEAEVLLGQAVKFDPSLAKAHYQLGALLEQLNRIDEAAAALSQAAASDPTYADPHYALARIYRRQGRLDEAKEALATFQRLHDAQRESGAR
jgi:tetratricopeptide (TPR) repeat protein